MNILSNYHSHMNTPKPLLLLCKHFQKYHSRINTPNLKSWDLSQKLFLIINRTCAPTIFSFQVLSQKIFQRLAHKHTEIFTSVQARTFWSQGLRLSHILRWSVVCSNTLKMESKAVGSKKYNFSFMKRPLQFFGQLRYSCRIIWGVWTLRGIMTNFATNPHPGTNT